MKNGFLAIFSAALCVLVPFTSGQSEDGWYPESFSSFRNRHTVVGSSEEDAASPIVMKEMTQWPKDKSTFDSFGQVPGLAVCPEGKLHIFVRRNVVWDGSSFDYNNNYLKRKDGPIKNDTVVVVHPDTGEVVHSWGKDRFYMPHGITVDNKGNIWVTDVALHQVLRFSKDNVQKPDLVLGEAFVPGKDNGHFCKPTDVVVSSNGYVYISDGYCNSRIVITDPNGKVLGSFDVTKGNYQDVPHSLTLLEKEDLLCVADREFRRIPCYSAGLRENSQAGKLMFDLRNPELGRVFAIDHVDNILLAINGPDTGGDRPVGIALDIGSNRVLSHFKPKGGFYEPHDVCVSQDLKSFYVAEISPNAQKKIVKFSVDLL